MEWTIQEVTRATGVTSRALRHYDAIGLLRPSRVSSGGRRMYDASALVRLQRILLLRELGLGLSRIARVLAGRGGAGRDAAAEAEVLAEHARDLRRERERLSRQIAAIESTITALKGGEELTMDTMFDGFDHTVHREEVESRWGADAYQRSDTWWRGLSAEQKRAWQESAAALSRDWRDAAERGVSPDSPEAQGLAERHAEWLRSIPGTPSGGDFVAYLTGLGDLYVADPRFGASYATSADGSAGAEFVRDALQAFAAGLVQSREP